MGRLGSTAVLSGYLESHVVKCTQSISALTQVPEYFQTLCNHARSLGSLQVSAVWPGAVRWTSEAGPQSTSRSAQPLGKSRAVQPGPGPDRVAACEHCSEVRPLMMDECPAGVFEVCQRVGLVRQGHVRVYASLNTVATPACRLTRS